jgi:molybdopterin-guanine dinucleotide biosynthesis protein A
MQVADKTRLIVGGRPLLDRAIAAVAHADRVVVVGPEHHSIGNVIWTCEDPAGGGPAAALAAGLEHVRAPIVVLLAGDLPFVTSAHVGELVGGVVADGALFVDDTGREQWLCSAWRTESLRSQRLQAGAALRQALGAMTSARLHPRAHGPQVWFDCDTPDDLRRAVELLP